MIDDNVRALGGAAHRNAVRWSGFKEAYPDRLTFEEDVAQMKEWIAERLKWLDQEIGQRARASSGRK
ncbi:MAG: hypothetical protein HYR88_11845 [Verrucomicrobia bacterium]|nr:hypothetical protein [Verrucomicrobiota bacterium]